MIGRTSREKLQKLSVESDCGSNTSAASETILVEHMLSSVPFNQMCLRIPR